MIYRVKALTYQAFSSDFLAIKKRRIASNTPDFDLIIYLVIQI